MAQTLRLHPAEQDVPSSILQANADPEWPTIRDFSCNKIDLVRSHLRPIRPDHKLSGLKRRQLDISQPWLPCLSRGILRARAADNEVQEILA
jgi:hypothetical protein